MRPPSPPEATDPASTSMRDIHALNVAIGTVGPVTQITTAAPVPPTGIRIFLLHDAADSSDVDPVRSALVGNGHTVLPPRRTPEWTPEDDAELRTADRAHVVWSVHSRRSARASAGLDAAYTLRRGPGFVHAESTDGAPIPSDVDGRRQRTWGRLAAAILMTAAWSARLYLLPWGFPTLVLGTVSILAGWALAVVGWTGLPRRMELSSALHEAAQAVAKADVPEILRAAEGILAWVFGKKTWSVRALVAGAMPTMVVVGFVAVATGRYFERAGHSWWDGAAFGVTRMWTVVLGNVVLDLVALQTTRTILPWILPAPTRRRIGVGLAADFLVLVSCTLGAAGSNTTSAVEFMNAGVGASGLLQQVFARSWLGVRGGLSLNGIINIPSAALIVGTGVGVVTGSFASLVHLVLLAVGALNRGLGRARERRRQAHEAVGRQHRRSGLLRLAGRLPLHWPPLLCAAAPVNFGVSPGRSRGSLGERLHAARPSPALRAGGGRADLQGRQPPPKRQDASATRASAMSGSASRTTS